MEKQYDPDSLTPREMEVLQLVTQGRKNKEIAATLCITEGTVEGHVRAIFRKLRVKTRAEASYYAMCHHLFDEKIMVSIEAPLGVSKV